MTGFASDLCSSRRKLLHDWGHLLRTWNRPFGQLSHQCPGEPEIGKFLELIIIQAYVTGVLFLCGCGGGMSNEQPWDRATRLCALALKARENNQARYAEQLEDIAAEAAAEADRLVRSTRPSKQSATVQQAHLTAGKEGLTCRGWNCPNPSTPIQKKSPGWRVGALGRKASGVRGWGCLPSGMPTHRWR